MIQLKVGRHCQLDLRLFQTIFAYLFPTLKCILCWIWNIGLPGKNRIEILDRFYRQIHFVVALQILQFPRLDFYPLYSLHWRRLYDVHAYRGCLQLQ